MKVFVCVATDTGVAHADDHDEVVAEAVSENTPSGSFVFAQRDACAVDAVPAKAPVDVPVDAPVDAAAPLNADTAWNSQDRRGDGSASRPTEEQNQRMGSVPSAVCSISLGEHKETACVSVVEHWQAAVSRTPCGQLVAQLVHRAVHSSFAECTTNVSSFAVVSVPVGADLPQADVAVTEDGDLPQVEDVRVVVADALLTHGPTESEVPATILVPIQGALDMAPAPTSEGLPFTHVLPCAVYDFLDALRQEQPAACSSGVVPLGVANPPRLALQDAPSSFEPLEPPPEVSTPVTTDVLLPSEAGEDVEVGAVSVVSVGIEVGADSAVGAGDVVCVPPSVVVLSTPHVPLSIPGVTLYADYEPVDTEEPSVARVSNGPAIDDQFLPSEKRQRDAVDIDEIVLCNPLRRTDSSIECPPSSLETVVLLEELRDAAAPSSSAVPSSSHAPTPLSRSAAASPTAVLAPQSPLAPSSQIKRMRHDTGDDLTEESALVCVGMFVKVMVCHFATPHRVYLGACGTVVSIEHDGRRAQADHVQQDEARSALHGITIRPVGMDEEITFPRDGETIRLVLRASCPL